LAVSAAGFLIVLCSVDSLLVFESQEGGDWSVEGLEFLGTALQLVNLLVCLSHFVVLLELNVSSSDSEQVNELGVVEGEGDHGNSDSIGSGVLISEIWERGESLFEHLLEVVSESGNLGLASLVVVHIGNVVVPEFFGEIQLAGVVSSSDGLDIPLNEAVFEDTADVVNEDHEEEGDEDGNAPDVESFNLSVVLELFGDGTGHLHEDQRLSAVAKGVIHSSQSDVVVLRLGDNAGLLSVAVGGKQVLEASEVEGLRALVLEVGGSVLAEVELVIVLGDEADFGGQLGGVHHSGSALERHGVDVQGELLALRVGPAYNNLIINCLKREVGYPYFRERTRSLCPYSHF
jgi:hypothetical protein